MRQLSGGNQQKVVLAREFDRRPKLLIASQPTRGLDVGATEFVYRQLLDHRAAGGATLLISSELEEILSLADRIAVMVQGGSCACSIRADVTDRAARAVDGAARSEHRMNRVAGRGCIGASAVSVRRRVRWRCAVVLRDHRGHRRRSERGSSARCGTARSAAAPRSPGRCRRLIPLVLVALGWIVAFSARRINIGFEGQILVGGSFATWVALKLSLPAPAAPGLAIGRRRGRWCAPGSASRRGCGPSDRSTRSSRR